MSADFYQLLGVSRNVSSDELREAFREKALENHPDRISHLPDDEKMKREDLMYQINEAYGILSNPQKRKDYDRISAENATSRRSPEGSTRTSSGKPATSYEDLFSSIFSDKGAFGGNPFGNMGNWGDFFGPATKEENHFMIPENDWGLLAALKIAYESKTDGKWRVKKAEDDKRRWMPEEVYSVKKEGENVFVFRRITDWRSEWDRSKSIKARKEGNMWETEEMKADTFLGEYYLCGKGRSNLMESYNLPFGFDNYLQALKSLASKFASKERDNEDKYDVTEELGVMNQYGRYSSKNTRIEGQSLWKDDTSREWVRKISFNDFWKRMSQAESRVVQVEGALKTTENQTKSSGENLG
jgi:hypothetical protein